MSTRQLRERVIASATIDQTVTSAQERTHFMSSSIIPHSATQSSGGWITFTYAQFGAAIFMTALGIWAMPVELMIKGYLLMSSVFLVGSTFTLAKTVRDEHEARRFAARIDEARTEKLLMEVGRGG
jgi:hypothetical protein